MTDKQMEDFVRQSLQGKLIFHQPFGDRFVAATAPSSRDLKRYFRYAKGNQESRLRRVMYYLQIEERQPGSETERWMSHFSIENGSPILHTAVRFVGLAQYFSPENFDISIDEARAVLDYFRDDVITIWSRMPDEYTREYARQTLDIIDVNYRKLGEI